MTDLRRDRHRTEQGSEESAKSLARPEHHSELVRGLVGVLDRDGLVAGVSDLARANGFASCEHIPVLGGLMAFHRAMK